MRHSLITLPAAVVLALVAPAAATQQPPAPSGAAARAQAPPSTTDQQPFYESLRARTAELQRVPIVLDPSAADPQSIDRFIARAAAAVPAERETVRAVLQKAQGNPKIADALADRALELRTRDHSGALVALALLGELRGAQAERRLSEFVALPLPTQGTKVEGELIERTALEQLQMKAVQGIAYARSATGDALVLKLAAGHPSRNVRAEAIESYLYNHQYSAEARKALSTVVRPAEQIFLDRPHLFPGMQAAEFNAQLRRYLGLHPDLVAPAPTKMTGDRATIARDRSKDAALGRIPTTVGAAARIAPPDRLK